MRREGKRDNVYINCSILGEIMSRDFDCGEIQLFALSNCENGLFLIGLQGLVDTEKLVKWSCYLNKLV